MPPAGIWSGSCAGPATENVLPEILTWDMTMAFEVGFVIVKLLTADCPIPTSPKSTEPGVIWTHPCEVEMATEVPHPEIANVKQQATAKARAVRRPFVARGPLATAVRNLSNLCELRWAPGISEQHLSIPRTKGRDVPSHDVLEIRSAHALLVKICSCLSSQNV